jgi:hypothetical protein
MKYGICNEEDIVRELEVDDVKLIAEGLENLDGLIRSDEPDKTRISGLRKFFELVWDEMEDE